MAKTFKKISSISASLVHLSSRSLKGLAMMNGQEAKKNVDDEVKKGVDLVTDQDQEDEDESLYQESTVRLWQKLSCLVLKIYRRRKLGR